MSTLCCSLLFLVFFILSCYVLSKARNSKNKTLEGRWSCFASKLVRNKREKKRYIHLFYRITSDFFPHSIVYLKQGSGFPTETSPSVNILRLYTGLLCFALVLSLVLNKNFLLFICIIHSQALDYPKHTHPFDA